ncbi:MAG: hypothetical protein Q7U28_02705 [Aquabacterium sp.]|nr:hypothetical protein [Aquabacterium sp.]
MLNNVVTITGATMNTAGRLLSIYDKLTERGGEPSKNVARLWAEVFELEQDTPHTEDDVVTCLQALRSEMDLLQSKFLSIGGVPELLQPGLSRFRETASPIRLNQQWLNLRDEFGRQENRVMLAWAGWALRDENEEDVASEDLANLQKELDALGATLGETEMSPYLREFVQRQMNSIRSALRVYRVQGIKPIEQALHQVVGAFTLEKNRVEAEQGKATEPAKGVLRRLGVALESTAKVADQVDKIRKAGEGGVKLAAAVAPFLINF